MKSFNEWRIEENKNENPDIFFEKIKDMANQLERELAAFEGERFDGFLSIAGSVKNLRRTISEIENGVDITENKKFGKKTCS